MDLSSVKSIFSKNKKGDGAAKSGDIKKGKTVKGGGKQAPVSPSKARLERRANDEKIIKTIKIIFMTIVIIAVAGIILSVFLYAYRPSVATVGGAGIKQYELTYSMKGLSMYSSGGSNESLAQQALDYVALDKIKEIIAKERGYSLTDSDRENIQYQLDYVEQAAAQEAQGGNFKKTGDDFLREGYGITKPQYKKILEMTLLGDHAVSEEYDKITVPDEDALIVYDNSIASYEEATVRHILLMYEGDLTDEEPRTAEESLQIAESVMARIISGEDMAELVQEYSEDSDLTNEGIYNFKRTASFEPGFLNWTFEEGRQVGDVGICETSYGYHVMRLEDMHLEPFEEVMEGIKDDIKEERVDYIIESWKNDPRFAVNTNQRVYDSLINQVLGGG